MDFKRKKPNRKSTPMKLKNGSSCSSTLVMVEFDTSVPLKKLREIVRLQLGDVAVEQSDIFLQDILLDPNLSLYDQVLKVSGNVELTLQWENVEPARRLTIVEVAKNSTGTAQQPKAIGGIAADSEQKRDPFSSSNMSKDYSDREPTADDPLQTVPNNPMKWTPEQVHLWMTWVAKSYNLDLGVIENPHMDGKTLCALSIEEFFLKFPYGNIFWSNLSLLKTEKTTELACLVDTGGDAVVNLPSRNQLKSLDESIEPSPPQMVVQIAENESSRSMLQYTVGKNTVPSTSRTHTGGQIQLWQFLLELLTDADERSVIRWVGNNGEFKFISPEKVAQKWGARKGKPAMNYEKLSRALRYYYDGEMISKVSGKRFQYKFVCNLKEILGFDAAELNRMVVECHEKRRTR